MKPGNRPNFISSSAKNREGKALCACYAHVRVYMRGKGWPKKKKKGWMRIVNRRVEIPIRKIERHVSREPETWRTLNLAAHRSGEVVGWETWEEEERERETVNRGRKEESRVTSGVESNEQVHGNIIILHERDPFLSPDLISGRS